MIEHIQRNPFICGGPVPPAYFVGREREVRTIFDQIASPARGSVAISGDRRIGKTSLLQYVCDPSVIESWGLSQNEYLFVYLDCPTIGSFTPAPFWREILTHLLDKARGTSLVSLMETIRGVLAKETVQQADFEIVLDEIHRAGRALALLLDEFEWVIDPEDERTTLVFLSGLRALTTRQPRVFSLIVATREELKKLCQPIRFTTSPFYNNFLFRSLTPFIEKEVNQLLEKTLEGTDVEFGPEERKCIQELGGTHPYLVQQAGSVIFDVRARGLELAHCLELIRSEFEEQTRHHSADVWDDSSPQERMLLILFALCGLARREERIYDVETLQHILSRNERALASLVKRGLITRAGPTTVLSPSTFESWVLSEIKSSDEREFAEYVSLMFDLLEKGEAECAVEAMRLASGRKSIGLGPARENRVGRYEIVEKLGSGNMGIVYKARDPHIGRLVALKVIHGSGIQSEESKERFRREAMTGQLGHPNIVAVHDADEDRGEPFIVMEYLEGPTLAQVIKTEFPLTLKRVVNIISQVCDALDYAHQRGVVHRDIKPSNIFLLENDQVKVADFGLAKLASGSDLTQEGQAHGTFGYASPEQILGQAIDGRSDIFSLGIVTYEMLTGKKPFEQEENVHFIISRTLDEKPLAFAASDSELLPGVEEILLKATAKDVNERYQTCAELMNDLKSIAQKLEKKSSVFISYSSVDRDFVERLASDLQASGIGVWFDKWEIKVGDSIVQKINDGIRDNDYLAIVLSPASVKSRWVRKELSAALMKELEESRSVVVLPILCKGCDIPPLLRDKHYADFRDDYERGLKEVLAVLAPE